MAKEYGNRRSSRSRSAGPHQFLVITLTFLLGYLTASFFDIETVSQWVNSQVLAHHEIKKEAPKPGAQHAAIPPKPKFEFYTLLTNEKVPNSQTNANSAASVQPAATVATPTAPTTASSAVKATAVNVANAAAPIKPNVSKAPVAANNAAIAKPATSDKGKYLVQVASFKARKDAEQMKGTLILKGFSVYIIPVSHPTKGNWFRVVVGPYSNRALAQQAQMTLAKNERLNGMVTSG
ncbi:cell division protein FtsN [Legionella qingyii]|uniref:Cell division protein FtsN n=1 Tax=Legionella qingyii TaxID=2184757 RepID=A0A317U1P0_9GAMM|nr:SPOR domain-containing protein [Legionella qingyii]PWY55145.1 cell division protein FtsN [Legionella qingyii]RUR25432.1 SPOR domain-containing protein [Legionella qingyii]RUR28457.1 SPOR domain-containing protein [Legionella qingyii]